MIKVGLVQANVGFSGQHYLPLSVAYLQAYAQQHLARPKDLEFFLPIYKPGPIDELSERLSEARVVAYSHYTWNAGFNLALARRTKERNPAVINVFGGPHVPRGTSDRGGPSRLREFHRNHPFVDVACHGEGEAVFAGLLANLTGDCLVTSGVPAVSFLDNRGELERGPDLPRMMDLDAIPSPFLTGVFQRLIDAHPDETWIGLLETNRGCPFSCTWCDWGSSTASKIARFSSERIFRELDWIGEHRIPFVFCADANFGILPRDVEIARYAAAVRARTGYPHKLSVQNTKNRPERSYEVQEILFDAGLSNGAIMALQSVNRDTLAAIKRDNISQDAYHQLQRRFARIGLATMTELIWPQPLETYDTFVDGICEIIASGQHNRIQFNKLSILPNAELGDPEQHRKYGLDIVSIPVANIHGVLTRTNDCLAETQDLVVATSTCSRQDHVRGLTFAWTVGLVHFNKLLQIPIVLLHELYDIPYRVLFDRLIEADSAVLGETRELFRSKALAIQNGDYEFCHAPEWLNIYWPPEEYLMIRLFVDSKLDAFYREAEQAFRSLLRSRGETDTGVVTDAVLLNRALLKLPFQRGDAVVSVSHNVWEVYQGVLTGQPVALQPGELVHRIDRSEQWSSLGDWCRRVIWWGNKTGAYLRGTSSDPAATTTSLSGHY